MRKIWMSVVAMLVGFVFSNLVFFGVDVLVLQIYPLPPGLWGRATLVEIVATRPEAAVALNLAGGMIATGAGAYLASRLAGGRTAGAGIVLTCLILLMAIANSILTHNFRWLHVIGFAFTPVVGYWGAKRGAVNA
jgi:hypothetical protein